MIGFGLPALLPLALLAAVPPLIHIISRARLRRFDFPTLRLLEAVHRERAAWSRLRELLLLALRTLTLLALLLALARPWLGSGIGADRPDLVLLVDDSYSMQYGSTWARACSLASALVLSCPPDARITLLSMTVSDAEHGSMPLAQATRTVDSLRPSNTAARVANRLAEATRIAESLDARLAVIGDLQRRSLTGDWSALPNRELLLLDAGAEPAGNVAITGLGLERPLVTVNRPTPIAVEVSNFNPSPVVVSVLVEADGQLLAGTRLTTSLSGHQTRTLRLEAAFPRTGLTLVTARLTTEIDSLEVDNSRYLAVEVRDSLSVLLVGSPRVSSHQTAAALASAPGAFISRTEATPDQLGRLDLGLLDVVVVLDALALRPGDWTRLLFGLTRGAGLVLMASPTTGADARLAGFASSTGILQPSGFLTLLDVDSLHPVFAGISPELWRAPRFGTVSRVRPDSARVLASFNDGSPFLLEAAGGRVIVWATGPDAEFTDLVHRAAFVPLLMSSVEYVAGGSRVQSRLVGDTLEFPAALAGSAVLTTPGLAVQSEAQLHDGRFLHRHEDTRLPGGYLLSSTGSAEPLALAAVNVDPEEGNLERIRPGELPRHIRTGRTVDGNRDLTQLLLLIAAAALAAELLLLL
ncbi:MAG: BatA domain-containing protein [bacterium]